LDRKTYKKAEIEEILKVKRGRLQEWVREGHLKPYKSEGQGKTALFDRLNLYQIHLFAHLVRVGIPRIDVAEYIGYAETNKYICYIEGFSPPPQIYNVAWKLENEPPLYNKDKHKCLYIISIKKIRDEVDEALRRTMTE
jgi:hypothetical protein